MINKDLITVRCFYGSEGILHEQMKQASYASGMSQGGVAPGKFCKLRHYQCLNIAFMALEIA